MAALLGAQVSFYPKRLGRALVVLAVTAVPFAISPSSARAQACAAPIFSGSTASASAIGTFIATMGTALTLNFNLLNQEVAGAAGSVSKSAAKAGANIEASKESAMVTDLNNEFFQAKIEILKDLAPVPSQRGCVIMTRQAKLDATEATVNTEMVALRQASTDFGMNVGVSARGENATIQVGFKDLTTKYWDPAVPCPAGMTCSATHGANAIIKPMENLLLKDAFATPQEEETAKDICRSLISVAPSDPVADLTTPAARAAYLRKSQQVARLNLAIEPCLRLVAMKKVGPGGVSQYQALKAAYTAKPSDGALTAAESEAAAIQAIATQYAAGLKLQAMNNDALALLAAIAGTELSMRVEDTSSAVGN